MPTEDVEKTENNKIYLIDETDLIDLTEEEIESMLTEIDKTTSSK